MQRIYEHSFRLEKNYNFRVRLAGKVERFPSRAALSTATHIRILFLLLRDTLLIIIPYYLLPAKLDLPDFYIALGEMRAKAYIWLCLTRNFLSYSFALAVRRRPFFFSRHRVLETG